MNRFGHYFNIGNPQWAMRRRIVVIALLFCGAEIVWASQWMRMETATAIIGQAFTMGTFIIGGYIFGGVTDDHLKRRAEHGALGPADQNIQVSTDITEIKP